MDPKKNFTEEDKDRLVKFLNLLAKHATFQVNTGELIEYFKLLSFMQQVLLAKVNSHVFEVIKVVEPAKEDSSKVTE